MKAKDFDKKFDEGKSVIKHIDLLRAKGAIPLKIPFKEFVEKEK